MGYSGYETTPPRPFRILAGGILALVCGFFGIFEVTYQFHRATAMSEGPVEMDFNTFLQNGPGENAFIKVTGVDLYDPTEQFLEDLEAFDGTDGEGLFDDLDPDSPEAIARLMESHLNGADPVEAIVDAIQPTKVIPFGADPKTVPAKLVLTHGGYDIGEAHRQIELDNSLSGLLRERSRGEVMMSMFGFDVDDVDANMNGADDPRFGIEPIEEAPDVSMASSNFLFTGLGMAFGLILCCSGGASIYTLWYFPLPSIISLAGYPMRYGRGGTQTRVIYFVIGSVLFGWGYRLMVYDGGFGTIDSNPFAQALGFAVMFTGVAACLSVPCQMLTRRFLDSMDVQPRKKQPKLTFEQACSLEPVVKMADYDDDELSESTAVTRPAGLKDNVDRLIAAGFSRPGTWVWHREEEVAPAAIQLGCQEMIVSDIEWSEDQQKLRSRLTSVLGDGMTIVTVSSNFDVQESRTGSNGIYQKAMSDEPAEMLAMHLERVVSLAESRKTSVVAFEEKEIRNVAQLGRRAFTDVRSQYGEILTAVGEKKYGRFSFPPKEVATA